MTGASAAIDNAWEGSAVTTDFLGNSQVTIPGTGLGLWCGLADLSIFRSDGTGGFPLGGAFRVISTSIVPVPGEFTSNGQTVNVTAAPTEITVTFSGNVNPSSVTAADLVLSGTALNGLAPAHATSLTWIDSHTVEFNLTGAFNNGGTLDVSLASNSVKSSQGTGVVGYTDNAVLSIGAIVQPINPTGGNPTGTTTGTGSTPGPVSTPAPAAACRRGSLHARRSTGLSFTTPSRSNIML